MTDAELKVELLRMAEAGEPVPGPDTEMGKALYRFTTPYFDLVTKAKFLKHEYGFAFASSFEKFRVIGGTGTNYVYLMYHFSRFYP